MRNKAKQKVRQLAQAQAQVLAKQKLDPDLALSEPSLEVRVLRLEGAATITKYRLECIANKIEKLMQQLPTPEEVSNNTTSILSPVEFYIAGVRYSDYNKINPSYITHGQPLGLRLNPKNPTDPKAIKIYWNTTHIGYVPKDSMAYTKMHDLRGLYDIKAYIQCYKPTNPPWTMFLVRVTFTVPKPKPTSQEPDVKF